jgi:hypothetical protein
MVFLQLGLISVNMDLVKWVYFGVAATTHDPDQAVREEGGVPQVTLHFIDGTQREFDLPEHVNAVRDYLRPTTPGR